MSLQSGRSYEIRINNEAGSFDAVSGTVDNFRFWSPDIFKTSLDYNAQDIPLADGGNFIGAGYHRSRTVRLNGRYGGLIGNANEQYPGSHLNYIYNVFDKLNDTRGTEIYLEVELQKTAGTTSTRWLFVKNTGHRFVPVMGTRYTEGEVILDFLAADPDFYEGGSARTASASAATNTANIGVFTTNAYDTNRFTIKIENVCGSTLANVSASSYTGDTWSIAGSVSASGDYWIVDHRTGTVMKYVSGTGTSDIANFTGTFFPIESGTSFIAVKCDTGSAYTGHIKGTVSYRLKARYDV